MLTGGFTCDREWKRVILSRRLFLLTGRAYGRVLRDRR